MNQKRDTRMGKRDKIDMLKEYVRDNHFRQDGVIGIRFTFLPEITKNHDEIYKMKHTGHYQKMKYSEPREMVGNKQGEAYEDASLLL